VRKGLERWEEKTRDFQQIPRAPSKIEIPLKAFQVETEGGRGNKAELILETYKSF